MKGEVRNCSVRGRGSLSYSFCREIAEESSARVSAARDAIIPLVLKGTKGKLDYDGRKRGLSSKGC